MERHILNYKTLTEVAKDLNQTLPQLLYLYAAGMINISLVWCINCGNKLKQVELLKVTNDLTEGDEEEWRLVRAKSKDDITEISIEKEGILFRIDLDLFPDLRRWFSYGCDASNIPSEVEIGQTIVRGLDDNKIWRMVSNDPYDIGTLPRLEELLVIEEHENVTDIPRNLFGRPSQLPSGQRFLKELSEHGPKKMAEIYKVTTSAIHKKKKAQIKKENSLAKVSIIKSPRY